LGVDIHSDLVYTTVNKEAGMDSKVMESLGWKGGPELCGPAAHDWVVNSPDFKPPEGARVLFRYRDSVDCCTYWGSWSSGDWEILDKDVAHWAIVREPTAR